MHKSLLLVAAILACCLTAAAQNANGILNGRISDASGASIAGAKVTIQNQETGVRQELTSSSEGRFYLPQVLIGTYRVTVEKSGFQKYIQSEVKIDVAQTVTLEVPLTIGDVATSVEITASAAQLSTETSSVSTVVNSKAILDLPSSGRNPFGLATLAPGVIPGS